MWEFLENLWEENKISIIIVAISGAAFAGWLVASYLFKLWPFGA